MHEYLNWDEKVITDFSDENVSRMYNDGFVFTRKGKGVMQQTRSVRINLSKFELSSENRRILRKVEGLNLQIESIPYTKYSWEIGKLAKDFYDAKFGAGTMSANKIKEMLTDEAKSNFSTLFVYTMSNKPIGYTVCYANETTLHYSYPFYNLATENKSLGLGMMNMAIVAAKENNKRYVYLGSFQRPTDTYKLQFAGLEWFDGERWSGDLETLKKELKV